MNIGERIRQVRKEARLTLRTFGDRIAITNGALSQIENGRANPSDQTIRLICREFDVSETWLRTGSGEMFTVKSRDQEVTEAVDRLLTGEPAEFRRRLVLLLSRLDVDQWEQLQKYASELAGQIPATIQNTISVEGETKEERIDREAREEAEEYYRLRLEEKRQIAAEADMLDGTGPSSSNSGANIA